MRIGPVIPDDQLDAAGDAFSAAVIRGMSAIVDRVAGRMAAAAASLEGGATTAAANPYLSVDDLVVIGGEWMAYVDGELIPVVEQLYRSAHLAWTLTLPTISPAWAAAVIPPVSQIAAETYLAGARNRLVGIGDRLWENARAGLLEGFDAGESIDDLASRIRGAVNVTAARAETIARTEIISAANIGSITTARTLPAEITKIWLATPDDRTRPTHRDADGQTQPIDEPFEVGEASLDVPGDPTGPPEEIINCRCAPGWDVPDEPRQPAGRSTGQTVEEPMPTVAPITAAAQIHTGAMIALIPDDDDAARLVVDDGETADQLHVTLFYLGDADQFDDAARARIVDAVTAAAAALPPIDAAAFGLAAFNPHADDTDTAVVLNIGGDGLDAAHDAALQAAADSGVDNLPEQHTPWNAHLTLAYVDTLNPDLLGLVDRLGPVRLSRIRVVFADDATDIDLSAAATVAAAAPVPDGEHFTTVVMEGVSTGLRTFESGALDWRTPPIAFHWERSAAAHGGMMEVVQVGLITRIWRDGDHIHFAGVLDLDSPDGAEYARKLVGGFARWSSIGLDEQPAELEFVFPDDDDGESDDDADMFLFPEPEQILIRSGTIGEVTAVSVPALADATVEPTAALIDELAARGITTPPPAAPTADTPDPDPTPAAGVETVPVVAAAHTITIPDLPPAHWFTEPVDVTAHGALTVTDEGRVYGYVAPANVAHRAFRDRRVTAPTGRVDYGRWLGGEAIVAGGGRVVCGPITMECGHIAPTASPDPAVRMSHYDNACAVVAKAAIGENAHGVWIAGALEPGVTPDQLSRMLACRLSGDWAPHGDRPGWREFVAALLVPVPGFPMARTGPSVTVEQGALVASSVPVRMVRTAGTPPSAGAPGARAALHVLARAIGRDPASRLRVMRDRVHNG